MLPLGGVGDQSAKAFLVELIRKRTGEGDEKSESKGKVVHPFVENAVIIDFGERAFDVLLTKYILAFFFDLHR